MLFNACLLTTALAAVSSLDLKQKSFNARVYIKDGSAATMPVYIFAVGSTFGYTDYTEFGVALAEQGVVTVIFDYDGGAAFKSDHKFNSNYPLLIQEIQAKAATIQAKSNSRVVITPDALFVGGHSAGGKAVFKWMAHNAGHFAGLSFWDPVNNDAAPPFTLPEGVKAYIATPSNSGCTGQIHAKNNAHFFHANTVPANQVIFESFNGNVAHNSLSTSGFLGQLTCYKKVPGFIESYAQKVASFIAAESNCSLNLKLK
jgi:hypothetical protein